MNDSLLKLSNWIKWYQTHPTQSWYALFVILIHFFVLYFLWANGATSFILEPKGKMKVTTVKLHPTQTTTKVSTALPQAIILEKKKEIQEAKFKPEPKIEKVEIEKSVTTKEAVIEKKEIKNEVSKKKSEKTEPIKEVKKKHEEPKKATDKQKKNQDIKPETKKNLGKDLSDKNKELLKKASESLAKLNNTKTTPSTPLSEAPNLIKDLHIDTKTMGAENGLDPNQMGYCDELVSRLKLLLCLPEVGEVKIRLTLDRYGKVITVSTVNSKSNLNQQYIEKTLPTLKFPPFDHFFGDEQKRSFLIALCND